MKLKIDKLPAGATGKIRIEKYENVESWGYIGEYFSLLEVVLKSGECIHIPMERIDRITETKDTVVRLVKKET